MSTTMSYIRHDGHVAVAPCRPLPDGSVAVYYSHASHDDVKCHCARPVELARLVDRLGDVWRFLMGSYTRHWMITRDSQKAQSSIEMAEAVATTMQIVSSIQENLAAGGFSEADLVSD
ncbi:hypothetical protein AB0K15_18965 [Amycolatopsis sp. NPDC049253]|uniref:hypothetical protein n=1 Tax=Amycolatopsis sp. NPDC049253 TaxID=3155274 RepID=UPI00341400DA